MRRPHPTEMQVLEAIYDGGTLECPLEMWTILEREGSLEWMGSASGWRLTAKGRSMVELYRERRMGEP